MLAATGSPYFECFDEAVPVRVHDELRTCAFILGSLQLLNPSNEVKLAAVEFGPACIAHVDKRISRRGPLMISSLATAVSQIGTSPGTASRSPFP